MANRAILLLCCAFASPGVLAAQDTVTLKVQTRAVQINVAVKDSEGRPVRGLRKEDFTVTDNGRRRDINLFSSAEEPLPAAPPAALPPNAFSNRFLTAAATRRVTAILMDAVSTSFEDQSYARAQAIKTVETMTPGEAIAIYALGQNLTILQNYTVDPDKLLQALRGYLPRQPRMPDRTGISPYSAERGPGSRQLPARPIAQMLMRERIETTLEALRTIARHMAAASGRKSILWITAGFQPNPDFREQIDSTIDIVNESNVAIYPVDARGLLPGRGAIINIQLMQELAQSTGGQAFYNRNDLNRAIQEAIEDSRHTYSLAFYLPEKDLDGQFHRLNVKVDRPGLELHYRRGYEAVLDPKASKSKEDLDAELLNPLDRSGVGIDARLEIVQDQKGRSLRISMVLDPATVTQTQPDGSGAMKLSQLFVETGTRGRVLGKFTSTVTVTVPPGKPLGAFTQTIPLREGAETLQIVVRDAVSGHTGTLTVPLGPVTEPRP